MAVAAAFVALLVACAKDPPLLPLPPPTPINTAEGLRARMEAVLAGDALMERIVGKWTDPDRCPPGSRDM